MEASSVKSVRSPAARWASRILRVMKRLGRLRAPQAAAGDRSRALSSLAAFQRVGHRRGGNCAIGRLEGVQRIADALRRNKRPRRVVDQHGIRREGSQRLDARRDGKLARRSPRHRLQKFFRLKPAGRLLVEVLIAGPDHGQNKMDARMVEESLQRSPQDGLPPGVAILLRPALLEPGADAAPRRHDDRGVNALFLVLDLHNCRLLRGKGMPRPYKLPLKQPSAFAWVILPTDTGTEFATMPTN